MHMSATANSIVRRRLHTLVSTLLAVIGCCAGQATAGNEPGAESIAKFCQHSQEVFLTAQKRFGAEPTNSVAGWEFARAAFDRGEFSTNGTERAALAMQGIAACRQVLKQNSNCAPAHFYLGMNLGQLARTKMLGAIPLVGEMEGSFKTARQLDENFACAGPDRYLGQLYLEAPGWPTSVGSKSKARKHLERAAELAPDYPENRINLAEAYLRWNEIANARQQMKQLEASLPTARTNLTGEAWAASWADWDSRLSRVQKKLQPRK